MTKDDIYFKLELVSEEPEYPELDYSNVDVYNPDDVIMTGWYIKSNYMVDSELITLFPELDEVLRPFTYKQPSEGTIQIESPSMDLYEIADLLRAEGYNVDYEDYMGDEDDEEDYEDE